MKFDIEHLNHLAERLDYKPDSQQHKDNVADYCKSDRMMAIAEAFRALEKRAEAAEAALKVANEHAEKFEREMYLMMDKAEAAEAKLAEAKLAELEKQEPYGYVVITGTGAKKFSTRHPRLRVTNEPPVAVFTQPAPASDLAGLVPDEMTWNQAHSLLDINQCGEDRFSAFMMGANYNRSAILRKIEEAK